MPTSHLAPSTLLHLIPKRANLLTALVAAGLCGGCGGGGGSTATNTESSGGDDPALWPGVIVRCGTGDASPRLICMHESDFKCEIHANPMWDQDDYVARALCADAWGGTPSDYAGSLHSIGDGNAQTPMIVSGDGPVDCQDWTTMGEHSAGQSPPDDMDTSIDESTAIVKQRYEPLDPHRCDACRICSLQNWGWENASYPTDKWNEYDWCPGKVYQPPHIDYEAFTDFTDNGCNMIIDPTDGGDPTGGETTGGDPVGGVWICNGAQEICGNMLDTFPDPDTTMPHCMISGILPPCVSVDPSTEANAKQECYNYCDQVNDIYVNEDVKDTAKSWSGLPCGQVYNQTIVEATDPASQCAGGKPMPSFNNPLPFLAAGEVNVGAGSATGDAVSGLLEVDVGSCPAGSPSCDISIERLVSLKVTIQGFYVTRDATGGITSSVPFVLRDLQAELVQPVHGQFSPRSRVVSFPTEAFYFSVETGEVTLDGTAISAGGDAGLFMVDSVRGTWNGQQLSLDMSWSDAGVSIWLHLTAG